MNILGFFYDRYIRDITKVPFTFSLKRKSQKCLMACGFFQGDNFLLVGGGTLPLDSYQTSQTFDKLYCKGEPYRSSG